MNSDLKDNALAIVPVLLIASGFIIGFFSTSDNKFLPHFLIIFGILIIWLIDRFDPKRKKDDPRPNMLGVIGILYCIVLAVITVS